MKTRTGPQRRRNGEIFALYRVRKTKDLVSPIGVVAADYTVRDATGGDRKTRDSVGRRRRGGISGMDGTRGQCSRRQ